MTLNTNKQKTIRVVLVAGIFPPDIGGPARSVPKISREIMSRGHQVEVLCLSDDPETAARDVYTFPVHRLRRGESLPIRALRTVVTAYRMARKADVVYANGLGLEAWLAARLAGKPLVQKIVGDPAWEKARYKGWFKGTIDEYQTASKGWRLWVLDRLRDLHVRRAQTIIVPSRYLESIVLGWGCDPSKVKVVYNAVSPQPPVPEVVRENDLAVTVCRLMPWKGIEGLLRVTASLPRQRLEIAGDGPFRAEYERLAHSLDLDGRVLFHGNVDEAAVSGLLRRAGAFVLNSSYEGLPHVVLEAMREGAPVIATRVGGTSEAVEDGITGILIRSGDDQALAAALSSLAENPARAHQLATAATEKLHRQFGFQTMVTSTIDTLVAAARGPQR
jgi:glycosyltransferase involved in cell wall biosynthesis